MVYLQNIWLLNGKLQTVTFRLKLQIAQRNGKINEICILDIQNVWK